jgi:hypothetical protein
MPMTARFFPHGYSIYAGDDDPWLVAARRDFDPEPAPTGGSAQSSTRAACRAATGGGSRGENSGEYIPTHSSLSSNRITSFYYSYPTRSTL